MKKVCAYLSIWMVFSLYGYNPVYIVVHGTWPADADWYLPGGDFFDELVRNTIKQKAYVVPYNWSGKLSHASRVQAAKGVAHVIQSYPVDTPIYVVGHSHGGNVALLASQILGKDRHNEHIIQALYTLGTPISEEQYFPDMNIIMYVYNFYSRSDMVQSVFGTFGREFADHRRIANLRITIEGKEPGHSDLHHPVVARWIPCIPDYLAQKNVNSFQFFSFINPGVIHFNFQSEPRYEIDLREVASKKLVRMYLLKRHPQIA